VCWCYGVVRLGWCGNLMQAEASASACIRIQHHPQPNHTVTPTHIDPEQYNPWDKSTTSRKLRKMNVLTFETCWAVNSKIIKQVTSSWSIFIQKPEIPLNDAHLYQCSTLPQFPADYPSHPSTQINAHNILPPTPASTSLHHGGKGRWNWRRYAAWNRQRPLPLL